MTGPATLEYIGHRIGALWFLSGFRLPSGSKHVF